MGFNTLPFIFIFLPVFLAVYYLMPERLRNGVLALGSLVFYLLGSGIALPLGLSFYSFQMAAYVIDVYRGRMEPEECPVSYAAEILMFPKLLSGPLMDPADLDEKM